MKNIFRLLGIGLLSTAGSVSAQTHPGLLREVSFLPGETMDYAVSYGVVPAGTMKLEVQDLETFMGRPAYHFAFSAESNRAVSFLYQLEQTEEAWFDAQELYSLKYERRSTENDKTRTQEYRFDQERLLRIEADGNTKPASPRAVDQLSMIYYLRLLPYQPGARFTLRNQADPEDNPIAIQVLKIERVKVPAGTFETYVLKLDLTTDSGVFKKGGENRVWVTVDGRHIPVKLSSKIGLGNFQAELVEYSAGSPVARR
ncbi:MAG TPA: DUF3108 domain-containing protein [Gemmatimonadota bacterium]|nr:DUF3108 domain-containing protein [Gemmatimonadota bacterium]